MRISSHSLLLLLLFSACTKSDLTPEEYSNWLKGNEELKRVKELDGFVYTVTCMPKYWMAFKALDDRYNEADYSAKLEEAGDMLYFQITIDSKEGGSPLQKEVRNKEEYFERLNYVSFKMKEDIKLVCGTSEMDVALYTYERAYDLNSRVSVMVGFEKPNCKEEDVVVQLSSALHNSQMLKFRFNLRQMESVPKLKLHES